MIALAFTTAGMILLPGIVVFAGVNAWRSYRTARRRAMRSPMVVESTRGMRARGSEV